ncbi:MAG: helix-turn-helix domain-containing protein [Alphaproteobacteria bacterium]|nr:helix-turn-helix domain-containing protein [Alphaproteobacteria bacterium]
MGRRKRTTGEKRANEMFGANLRALRKERDYTCAEIGHAVGIGGDAISKYERGEREPTILLLLQFAQLFHVSLDQLITGEAGRARLLPIRRLADLIKH